MIHGYDIAGYQPKDFPTAGIDFVVIKITENYGPAHGYTNPNWLGQRATARAHSLVTGFYHFARPGSMTAQADFFLSKISLQPGDILAFDWEDSGVSSNEKDAWIRYVQARAPGHKVILYCNKNFWFNRDTSGFAGDGLWIADPSAPAGSPGISASWVMHQYSEAGGYDHDVAPFDSRAAMATWATGEDLMTAVDLTPAAVKAVADAIRFYAVDNPLTSDDSQTTLGGMWWDTGRNAGSAADTAQQALTTATSTQTKVTTLATSFGNVTTTLETGVSSILTKLDVLQAAVTDPTGLIDAIREELTSFKLVLQQNPPEV